MNAPASKKVDHMLPVVTPTVHVGQTVITVHSQVGQQVLLEDDEVIVTFNGAVDSSLLPFEPHDTMAHDLRIQCIREPDGGIKVTTWMRVKTGDTWLWIDGSTLPGGLEEWRCVIVIAHAKVLFARDNGEGMLYMQFN